MSAAMSTNLFDFCEIEAKINRHIKQNYIVRVYVMRMRYTSRMYKKL